MKILELQQMGETVKGYAYYKPADGHYMTPARCTNCEAKRYLEIKKGILISQSPIQIECDNCGCVTLSYCDEGLAWITPLVELENWKGERIFCMKQIFDLSEQFKKVIK